MAEVEEITTFWSLFEVIIIKEVALKGDIPLTVKLLVFKKNYKELCISAVVDSIWNVIKHPS